MPLHLFSPAIQLDSVKSMKTTVTLLTIPLQHMKAIVSLLLLLNVTKQASYDLPNHYSVGE
eukprot:5103287-Amphidinium_carterae.2